MDLQEKRQLDLAKQVATVKVRTRPWRAIIFSVLAIAAAVVSYAFGRGLKTLFESGHLAYADEHPPQRDNPVAPAHRSRSADAKAARKVTASGEPARSFRDLIEHLATLTRQTIVIGGHQVEKITTPPPSGTPSTCSAPPSQSPWSRHQPSQPKP